MKKWKYFKRIDSYLLRNHPGIWSIQLHRFVPWFFAGLMIVAGLISLQNPETYHSNDDEIALSWLYILSTGGLIIWLVYMFRFNPLKSFGNRSKLDEGKNFVLTFLGVAFLALAPFVFHWTRHFRVKMKMTNAEMVQHVNHLNIALGLNRSMYQDSIVIQKEDTSRLRIMLGIDGNGIGYDSVYLNPSDSNWYCFQFGHFKNFDAEYYSRSDSREPRDASEREVKPLTGKEIFYALQKLKTVQDTARVLEAFRVGAMAFFPFDYKLEYLTRLAHQDKFPNFFKEGYTETAEEMEFRSHMQSMESVVNQNLKYYNIFYWGDWYDILHGLYYLTFFITLLIIIFRNMRIKTFFISIGVGAVLPVIIVLLALAFGAQNENQFFMVAALSYVAVWLVYIALRNNSRRSMIPGIALNLLMCSTPLLGIFIAGWWVEIYRHSTPYTIRDSSLIREVVWYGEVGGMLLFFLLLQPLFKRLYVHWYALPKE